MIMTKVIVMFHVETQPSFCSGNCYWWSHCNCLWVGKGEFLSSNSIIISHDMFDKHTSMKNASWNHQERKNWSTMRPCPRWRRTSTQSWTTRDNSTTKSRSSEMASPGKVWRQNYYQLLSEMASQGKVWCQTYCNSWTVVHSFTEAKVQSFNHDNHDQVPDRPEQSLVKIIAILEL